MFRSVNKLIVDSVCKEFIFVLEFFDLKMTQMSPVFIQIFSRVINKYIDWLTQYSYPQLGGLASVQAVATTATSGASNGGGLDI